MSTDIRAFLAIDDNARWELFLARCQMQQDLSHDIGLVVFLSFAAIAGIGMTGEPLIPLRGLPKYEKNTPIEDLWDYFGVDLADSPVKSSKPCSIGE